MGIRVLPLIVGGVVGMCATIASATEMTEQDKQAQLYKVGANEASIMLSVGGVVVPHKSVMLNAQIPGRVLKINGEVGDAFQKGSALVELSEDALRAKLNEAVAQREAASAKIRNAKIQYQAQIRGDTENPMLKNTPMSWMSKMTPKQRGDSFNVDAERVRVGIDQASSAYRIANAQIAVINSKFRDAKSMAPMNGVIMKKFVEEGDTVQPGMKLIEFADTSILLIKVEIPVQQIEGVHEGKFVEAQIDKRTTTQARVAKIYPVASAQHTITVEMELPEDLSEVVSPGMYAEVYLADITKSVQALPIIPKAAMRLDRSLPQVYVMKNNRPVLRTIRIEKNPVAGDQYLVLTGLKVGDVILKSADRKLVNAWVRSMRDKSDN